MDSDVGGRFMHAIHCLFQMDVASSSVMASIRHRSLLGISVPAFCFFVFCSNQRQAHMSGRAMKPCLW